MWYFTKHFKTITYNLIENQIFTPNLVFLVGTYNDKDTFKSIDNMWKK